VAQDDVVWLRQALQPGRHLDGRKRELRLGGGGANVAIPLRHAGHHVQLVAAIGADPTGEWILARLESAGIDTAAITRLPGESTRSLVLVDPGGERTIVNLRRCAEARPPERLRSLAADAVYVRSRELDLGELLAERVAVGPVVAHMPPLAAGSRPATVLLGSESDLPAELLADPWAAGLAIAGGALRWVVLTRGPRGALAFAEGQRLVEPAPVVAAVDTTGAGDVFAAGLVHSLVEGRPMAEALRAAVAWGAASVACAGLPDQETIRRLA
jgi:sugar/nucleoside kinase (ribokinase family)